MKMTKSRFAKQDSTHNYLSDHPSTSHIHTSIFALYSAYQSFFIWKKEKKSCHKYNWLD